MVFVLNRNRKSELLAILSTDINLTPEQVIEYFGITLFLFLVEEFSDAAMREALSYLLSMFAEKVAKVFSIPVDSILAMVDEFMAALPNDIKRCLIKEEKVA